jgi:hypothetical protein
MRSYINLHIMKKAIFTMAMLFFLLGVMAQDASFTKPADFFGFEPGPEPV